MALLSDCRCIVTLILTLVLPGLSVSHAQTNDCEGAEVICDDGIVSFTPMGPGGPDLGAGTFTTCGTSEHQSAWYYFEFNSMTPPGSIIEFTITPFVPFDDYDFAVWGPGTPANPLQCDNMGASIRCDFAIPTGNGGTGLVEGGGGSGFQEALTVNPGDGFYLLVDNFDNTTTGFDLTWAGSAAPFLDCDATPPCEIITEAGPDTTICNSETIQLNGTSSGGMGTESYEWTAVPIGAIGFLSDPNIPNPTLDGGGSSGTFVFTLTTTEGTCTSDDEVSVTLLLDVDPVFNDQEICESGDAVALPTTAVNGIQGTWAPPVIDPTGLGGTTVTAVFTPSAGQMVCLTPTQFDIPILEAVEPVFTFPTDMCPSDPTFFFPNTSTNGITGTWVPSSINPSTIPGGSLTTTFTPNNDECATTIEVTIMVETGMEPIFDPVGPLCELDAPVTLPVVDLNGITGTWDVPVIDPSALGGQTISVVFTPDPGQGDCTVPTTLDVDVDQATEPLFEPVELCELDAPFTLPLTSTNNIAGTWDVPVIDPMGQGGNSVTAVFTPDAGQGNCVDEAQITIEIAVSVVPVFNLVDELCDSDGPLLLPATSSNGISGTWSPPTIDPVGLGGTTASAQFTPDPGICAEEVNASIDIIESTEPQFDPVGPLCAVDPPVTLATVSLEGISGTWDVPVIDPDGQGGTTVNATFTPDAGQGSCILTSTMSVLIEVAQEPVFDPLGPICELDGPVVLPTSSLDGVTGTWDIPVVDPAGQGGTVIDVIFTPDPVPGECLDQTTASIAINAIEIPVFDIPSSLCESDDLLLLPTTSLDGITGSWNPSVIDPAGNGGATIAAVFTPDAAFCAEPVNLVVAIEENIVPEFDPIGPLCAFDDVVVLPIVSNNGVEGAWDLPQLDPADFGGSVVNVTFTPDAGNGQCVALTQMSIEVSSGQVPVFDDVGPLCEADGPISLPTVSLNGIPGDWDVAVIDPAGAGGTTITSNFTPDIGVCASVLTIEVEILELPEIIAIDVQNPADCNNANGEIVITADGTSLEYSIDGGVTWQGENVFQDLGGGVYDIIVRPAGSLFCYASDMVVLSTAESPELQEVLKSEPTDCMGNDGMIEIIADGAALEYSIDGGMSWQSSSVFSGLSAGSYQIAVRPQNSSGCQTTATATLLDPPVPQITNVLTVNPSDCGMEDGEIVAVVNADAIEFSLDTGATWQVSNTFSGLPPGDYSVIVRHAGSTQCADTALASIVAPPVPQIDSVGVAALTDCGSSDGRITVYAQGMGLQYSIDGGATWQSSAVFSGLGPGQFTVLVRRAAATSCTDEIMVDVMAPGAPEITALTTTDPSDCSAADGAIVAEANGTDLEYSIDDGQSWQSSNLFDNLTAGTYTIVVRPLDAISCTAQASATLVSPSAPVIGELTLADPSDCGVSDGSIEVQASGTELEFALTGIADWQSGNVFVGLGGGTYTVAVRPVGSSECIATREVVLTAPVLPQAQLEVQDVSDCGVTDGRITIVSPDTLLEYVLDTGIWQTSAIFSDLAPGQYDVGVRRVKAPGCAVTLDAEVGAVEQPEIIDLLVTGLSDCNRDDGAVEIVGSGAATEYALDRNGPWKSSGIFNNLSAGNYTAYIRNFNATSCLDSMAFTLENPDCNCSGITVTAQGEGTSCSASDDGMARITGVSGTDVYEVLWETGDTGTVVGNLSNGWISFMLTYNTSCIYRDSVFIDTPEPLDFAVWVTDTDCPDATNGQIELDFVTGGTGIIEYAINGSPFQTDPQFSDLSAGLYIVVVRDANLCTEELQVEVESGDAIEIDLPETIVIQLGEEAVLHPEFQVLPADSFAWSGPGVTDPSVLDLVIRPGETALYTFTVYRGMCSAQQTVTVIVEFSTQVYIPNVFSPNGDGINDEFSVHGDPASILLVDRLTIFDRWGDVLFEARDFQLEDPAGRWDGTVTGHALNPGVFVYAMHATLVSGVEIFRRGSVTLVQ